MQPAPTPAQAPPAPSTEQPQPKPEEAAAEPTLSSQEITRQLKFIQADRLYLAGKIPEAEKIYREVKEPFTKNNTSQERKAAILDSTQLSPAGTVYWRESEAGIASKLQTRTLVPLQLLVEQYPEFIPGHIRFAEELKKYDRTPEALDPIFRTQNCHTPKNRIYPDIYST